MSSESKTQDWSKPAAMAIPKGGYFQDKVEQGRYGPIFPKTPACYGFSIVAKIIPGREEKFYEHARTIEKTIAEQPDALAVLKLHYLRWFRALIYDVQVGICLRTSNHPRPPASPRLDSSKARQRVSSRTGSSLSAWR